MAVSKHVEGDVPNLINGISQQSAASRLTSQAEACENNYTTIVDGLTKRPRTEHLAKLGINLPAGSFTHFILRDEIEKYILAILPNGNVRVWDFLGNEKIVTNESAAYLSGLTKPEDEIRAVTIADHTFIVNKKKVVAAGTDTAPTRPYEALVSVLAGNYAKKYKIFINGAEKALFDTPDGSDKSHGQYIDTVYIAAELNGDLNTGGFNTSPWATGRYHSTVYIRNNTTDFSISSEDGYAGKAMKEVKGKAQKFSDLPNHAPDGVVFEVVGEEASNFDNYWVKFEKDASNSSGIWKETTQPGTKLGIDGATMPHTLVRNSNGTFTFKAATWDKRKCGGVETVPDPSFVGETIEDVFFHKNRFGILTKENCVMTEAGKFFNFFRATLTALLDSDPIDIAASHVKVSLLHHAVPYSDILLLFSDQTQFKLDGNELFTPKTVNAKPLSELAAHPAIRPQTAGTSAYFLSERGGWSSLIEYFIDKQVQTADADDVSAHCPSYIPAGVRRLCASPDLDMVVVHSSGDPAALYVYKYFWSGQEKLQSAWTRWTYPNVTDIVDVTFDKGDLLVLFRRAGDLHLEKKSCEQGLADPGMAYTSFLDQHVVLATGTYNSGTGRTKFTLPYNAPLGLVCLTAPGGSERPGVKLPYSQVTAGPDVYFEGNLSAEPMRFGVPYRSEHEFSEFFKRSQDGKSADADGRLQLLSMAVTYAKTAYFRVEVTCEARPTRTYTFTGRIISDPDNVLGEIALDNGRFSFPLLSRSDRVKVKIVNDSWLPSSFVSAKWRGTWNPSSRQQ